MSEQTFRSPGFFEQEIELSTSRPAFTGTPAGVIGAAEKGPAFVPVTIGSFADFEARFGTLDPNRNGPYAVREFLKHRSALTYVRVLGAGANDMQADIANTVAYGTVKNAGFRITNSDDDISAGRVKFISSIYNAIPQESAAYPIYTDNNSVNASEDMHLVNGVIFLEKDTNLQLIDHDLNYGLAGINAKDFCKTDDSTEELIFKIAIKSTADLSWSRDEFEPGLKILSASLNASSVNYIGKILNTDPLKFQSEKHLLYMEFPVESEIAPQQSSITYHVLLTSGSLNNPASLPVSYKFRDNFGRFDTRYTTPKTTNFISQPFGRKEYDLFHFETISDGAWGNDKFKVSIANLRASTDPANPYGTFEVQVRAYDDVDSAPQILEYYPECNLNPRSDRYVARLIGDKKVQYDFDQENPNERRSIISGKYPNVSSRIRIRMSEDTESGEAPKTCLPFGFRGIPTIKTSNRLTTLDAGPLAASDGRVLGTDDDDRLWSTDNELFDTYKSPIVPPFPLRFKVTRGPVNDDPDPTMLTGAPGPNERIDARIYWGAMTKRLPTTGSIPDAILQSNAGSLDNTTTRSYTKFAGISKLDVLITGSAADEFHNNKFTLSRVTFDQYMDDADSDLSGMFAKLNGSPSDHMLGAAYIRNAVISNSTYTATDLVGFSERKRYTFASLISTSSVLFNKFTQYAKFTNVFYGGFDGLNILDRDVNFFRDRAFSSDTDGKAIDGDPNVGLSLIDGENPMGAGRLNNSIASINKAVDILTDPMASNINILAIPGVRDPFVTDHALGLVRDYSQAFYVMDIIKYDQDAKRLYDDSKTKVDVRKTAELFESRAIDNNYAATYFPDVHIDDPINNRIVKVPASVAALGTLAYNDKVAFPWYAPAGFNRGGMDFVRNAETRLSSNDRDILYDARINPIAVFPNTGYVIFGQKTLQQAKSALDRVNVRRLMLEIKRQVVSVSNGLLFEPNNATTRARFVGSVTPLLSLIQLQAGIEQFRVIMDDSNNTPEDVAANKLNGRIIVVPTRAVEFISIDFVITNSGVAFA
jgi:hypothetical protein